MENPIIGEVYLVTGASLKIHTATGLEFDLTLHKSGRIEITPIKGETVIKATRGHESFIRWHKEED